MRLTIFTESVPYTINLSHRSIKFTFEISPQTTIKLLLASLIVEVFGEMQSLTTNLQNCSPWWNSQMNRDYCANNTNQSVMDKSVSSTTQSSSRSHQDGSALSDTSVHSGIYIYFSLISTCL